MANGNDKGRRESETPAPIRKPADLEKSINSDRKVNEQYSPRPVPPPKPPEKKR